MRSTRSIRADATRYHRELELYVDRKAARFAAWYEMFPRSQGTVPGKGATFDDCIRRLPYVRDMGFDVLYFVPIHPIGKLNRKGRNNSVTAAPGEPGSPYAIGSALGGHTAVDPELGTLDDFRRLVGAAREHGLDLAVRGGGHSVPGFGTCDGGVVIDLSGMRGVRVDPSTSTARADGGATWGDFNAATHAFGLATTGGIISTTGVAGLTLGGGIGHLSRAFGLTIDSLLSAEVVLADGRNVVVFREPAEPVTAGRWFEQRA